MEILDLQGVTKLASTTILLANIPYTSNSLSCSTLPKGYPTCDALMRGAILQAGATGSVSSCSITVRCIEFSTTTLTFMDFYGAVSNTFFRSDSVAIWQSQAIVAFLALNQATGSSNNVVWILFTYLHVPIIVHSANGAASIAAIASNCSFMSVYPMEEGFFEPALAPLVIRPQLLTCTKVYQPGCWITNSFSRSLTITLTLSSTISLSNEHTSSPSTTAELSVSLSRGTASHENTRSGTSSLSHFSTLSSILSTSRTKSRSSWTMASPTLTSISRVPSKSLSTEEELTGTLSTSQSTTSSLSATLPSGSATHSVTRDVSRSHVTQSDPGSSSLSWTYTTSHRALTLSLSTGSLSVSLRTFTASVSASHRTVSISDYSQSKTLSAMWRTDTLSRSVSDSPSRSASFSHTGGEHSLLSTSRSESGMTRGESATISHFSSALSQSLTIRTTTTKPEGTVSISSSWFPSLSQSSTKTEHTSTRSKKATLSPDVTQKHDVSNTLSISRPILTESASNSDHVQPNCSHALPNTSFDFVSISADRSTVQYRTETHVWYKIPFTFTFTVSTANRDHDARASHLIDMFLEHSSTSPSSLLCEPASINFRFVFTPSLGGGTTADLQQFNETVQLRCTSISASVPLQLLYNIDAIDNMSSSYKSLKATVSLPPPSISTLSSSTVHIDGVSGCPLSVFPSTALCPLEGGVTLTFEGVGFDAIDAEEQSGASAVNDAGAILSMQSVPSTSLSFNDNATVAHYNSSNCTNLTVQSPSQLTCVLGPGRGSFARGGSTVIVWIHNRSITATTPSTAMALILYVPAVQCPTSITDTTVCSGNGKCNWSTGTCNCKRNDVDGYWQGDACQYCLDAYANSTSCRSACPLGETEQLVCSGHGVCSDGTCVQCDVPYTGSSCSTLCPQSTAGVCNGHGVCDFDGQCLCSGNWTGDICSACAEGWVGANCEQKCLSSAAGICNGHGECLPSTPGGIVPDAAAGCLCDANYCGSSCEASGNECFACSETYLYGPTCSGYCLGISSDRTKTCSGNGYCQNGTAGSGLCVCDSGYGHADCSQACPRSGAGAVCSGRGNCSAVDATCTCTVGFGGAGCELACPTGISKIAQMNGAASNSSATRTICSSQGVCNYTDATCTCTAGFFGAACEQKCSDQCKHGDCVVSKTPVASSPLCRCYQSLDLGFWSGSDCSVCSSAFTGAQCTVPCPLSTVNGLPCEGRGRCVLNTTSPSLAICDCTTATVGVWSGSTCSSCAPGYFGPTCSAQCPGSACSPCNGRGTCSDGLTGTGLCSCFGDVNSTMGSWRGAVCDNCAAGVFGPSCTGVCPRSSTGLICTSHGTCSDGVDGSGLCTCLTGFSGAACGTCAAGYYGNACTRCATLVATTSCSGHGTCDDGRSGTGACTCVVGFGGAHCGFPCPVLRGVTCGASGTCTAANVCACTSPTALGPDGTCSQCVPGRWGVASPSASCVGVCPPCLHGTCSVSSGLCVCAAGYWGPLCALTCPGGAANVCSGHGVCDTVSGVCTCANSTVAGFYTGAACSSCQAMYRSPQCNILCPGNASFGTPCTARGACWSGNCTCAAVATNDVVIVCGAACERTNTECLSTTQTCPMGYYGATCSSLCPGAVVAALAATTCSGHGLCDSNNGTCTCTNGYGGFSCSLSCPLSIPISSRSDSLTSQGRVALPCGGLNQGSCADYTTCSCTVGYWGDACDYECPGGASTPCSDHGECSASGFCTCDGSTYGAACEFACPGGIDAPCSLHGVCTATGACLCYANWTSGFYSGASCDRCATELVGAFCNVTSDARSGFVVGQECICAPGYVGPSCSIPCPGVTDNERNCSGHGVCRVAAATLGSSAGSAKCVCAANYYGATCETFCTPTNCQRRGLYRAQCNAQSGACECLNAVEGHFSGAACDTCTTMYWGAECDRLCPCNSRGSCNRYTGQCDCFAGQYGNGSYSGTSCSLCATGYIGIDCALNTELSFSSSSARYPATGSGTSTEFVVLRDTETSILYAGSLLYITAFTFDVWGTAVMTLVGRIQIPSINNNNISSSSSALRYLGLYNSTHVVAAVSGRPMSDGSALSRSVVVVVLYGTLVFTILLTSSLLCPEGQCQMDQRYQGLCSHEDCRLSMTY
ncbi:Hypothetical protein, putative [Bodo saltans]|uniref:Uncharacterized protein n=1 Tax=Bodo saltans TaxID=75058 RepID=A0A0S4IRI1_BODSA|nr:Hypothetical protein, putative [Bodo saltans]|eukprot:CUE73902.1 Hypothetical protein, putative [Bodo saltans]